MSTPAFNSGRYMIDVDGSGMAEHAVHHFHGMAKASPLNSSLF